MRELNAKTDKDTVFTCKVKNVMKMMTTGLKIRQTKVQSLLLTIVVDVIKVSSCLQVNTK